MPTIGTLGIITFLLGIRLHENLERFPVEGGNRIVFPPISKKYSCPLQTTFRLKSERM